MSDKSIKEILEVVANNEHGFYLDVSSDAVKTSLERHYNPEIIKHYFISSIIPNSTLDSGREYIAKFKKRITPLTDEEYKNQYWSKSEE